MRRSRRSPWFWAAAAVLCCLLGAGARGVLTVSLGTLSGGSAAAGVTPISPYSVSTVQYHLNSVTPNSIDSVTFSLSPTTANSVWIKLNGTPYQCTTGGSPSCTTSGATASSANGTTMTVVGAQ
jgi:hypothetical protein